MRRTLLALLLMLLALPARAGSTNVAVAANFTETATAIAAAFKAATGHEAVLSFGASGALYAQITQGAPFDILLSADQERVRQTEEAGLAVPETRFTYAVGRLVLWSRDGRATLGDAALKAGGFRKLAIANPASAPYGGAAIETLRALKLYDGMKAKIVQGASIAQTFQFAATGNADMAFVALSQVISRTEGGRWLVPQTLHKPILQDAVLLRTGEANAAAKAFMAFLKGDDARFFIERQGYETQAPR
jgi:molybdate transport system substrate-binding protein